MTPTLKPVCGRSQSGFTLLEILVAIVVLSIGLLGLAGLQAASLNNNQTAYYRSIATQQAYDMADRMRANLAGVGTGDYDGLSGTPEDPGCIATEDTGCEDLEDVAATDYFQWRAANAALLPGGNGTVTCCSVGTVADGDCVCNASRKFEIAVTWTEKATSSAGAATQSFVTRIAP